MEALRLGLVGFLGSLLLRTLLGSCRIRVEGHPDFLAHRREGKPVVYAFWHRYILPLTYQHRGEGACVLVSQHRDGEYIARVLHRLGLTTARGSSTRGGASGLRALVRAARSGVDLALTPDGPRGPRYAVKEGVILTAQLAGYPIIPITLEVRRAWVLRSWDGFVIPKPFSPIRIHYGAPLFVERDLPPGGVEAVRKSLEMRLLAGEGASARPVAEPRWWRGELPAPVDLLLRLPEALFRGAVGIRAAAHGMRGAPPEPPIPVISVGNLTVGGTGKTPVTAWVVGELLETGHLPAVLARGYGADEVALHRRWHPSVPVVAHPRRVQALAEAVGKGCTAAVADDAFQHRALPRSVDLVLVSAETVFPPRLLPRGPYREGLGALERAHAVVVTRRTATLDRSREVAHRIAQHHPDLPVFQAHLAPAGWQELGGGPAEPPPEGVSILALSSIARPDAFLEGVAALVAPSPVRPHTFRDHHAYSREEVARIAEGLGEEGWVVTTEKDAVKLLPFASLLPRTRVLALSLEWEEGGPELQTLLRQAVEGRG